MADQYAFPEKFYWGAATASYQIEGAVKEDGRGETIWDRFCKIPGAISNGDTGEIACDSYRRYKEDVAICKKLNLKAYRFSIAWSRIFPDGFGEVNRKGLQYYENLVEELLSNNITPFVTIYHWDLPQRLQEEGGWTNRQCIDHYLNYCRVLFKTFHGKVKHWITFNEPWVAAILGYATGMMAPGQRDYAEGLLAAHNMLVSHGKAVRLFREMMLPGEIGIVLNLSPRKPAGDAPEDAAAACRNDGNNNRWFLEPLFKGSYPKDMLEYYRSKNINLPEILKGDMEIINTRIDFLGINYYCIEFTKYDPKVWPMEFSLTTLNYPTTNYGWAVTEEGITEILLRVTREYGVNQVYITENGASYLDVVNQEGEILDEQRVDYLNRHIKACHKAIEQGVNLCGYFVWSLLDNFEWNTGYDNKFGLVYLDRSTGDRIIKKSGRWYADVIINNGIVK